MQFVIESDTNENVIFEDCEVCGVLVLQSRIGQHLRDHGRDDLGASKDKDLEGRPPHLH